MLPFVFSFKNSLIFFRGYTQVTLFNWARTYVEVRDQVSGRLDLVSYDSNEFGPIVKELSNPSHKLKNIIVPEGYLFENSSNPDPKDYNNLRLIKEIDNNMRQGPRIRVYKTI